MRAYRDWLISGDDSWLKKLYPKLKTAMDYSIQTWDPDHTGTLMEPHHNTYDIEFWGADGMGAIYYLGALEAFIKMTEVVTAESSGKTGALIKGTPELMTYIELFNKGKVQMETNLWNGEYFIQNIQWKGLHHDPLIYRNTAAGSEELSPEVKELLDQEGPRYQYGKGCLSDGVIGVWLAKVCGLPDFIDQQKVVSHLTPCTNTTSNPT